MPALAQNRTIARLSHESSPEVTRSRATARANSPEPSVSRSEPLSESVISRSAATALFVNGNLERARQLAERAGRRDHRDAEALFVLMEVAAMQADEPTMLNAALRLCEVGGAARQDPRVRLAAARVRESAANTAVFRPAVARLQALLADAGEDWPELNRALLQAAMDGVPGLYAEVLARASGILTEWRIVGLLGRQPLLEFERLPISPNDDLAQSSYDNRAVENFQFPDGFIRLPPYLSPRGIYYGASHFAALAPATWTVSSESAGAVEIYVDGTRVLAEGARPGRRQVHSSATFEVAAGPHRVMARFAGSALPLRLAISRATYQTFAQKRTRLSAEESSYDFAATSYATGEFGRAIEQINALPGSSGSAELQFLLAQSWTRENPTAPEGLRAWSRVLSLAPGALAAKRELGRRALTGGHPVDAARLARNVMDVSPDDRTALETLAGAIENDPTLANSFDEASLLWSKRLAEHPSCETSSQAMMFYRGRRQFAEAGEAQQKLDGCAPESLAYAQSLEGQGRYLHAARALQTLLAASPLNRAARLMLVRELQLGGDDSGRGTCRSCMVADCAELLRISSPGNRREWRRAGRPRGGLLRTVSPRCEPGDEGRCRTIHRRTAPTVKRPCRHTATRWQCFALRPYHHTVHAARGHPTFRGTDTPPGCAGPAVAGAPLRRQYYADDSRCGKCAEVIARTLARRCGRRRVRGQLHRRWRNCGTSRSVPVCFWALRRKGIEFALRCPDARCTS